MSMETKDLLLGKAKPEDWESMYRNRLLLIPHHQISLVFAVIEVPPCRISLNNLAGANHRLAKEP